MRFINWMKRGSNPVSVEQPAPSTSPQDMFFANADKIAKNITQDGMPKYNNLSGVVRITPALIGTAFTSFNSEGKLQGLNNLYDLVLEQDDNLQNCIDVRKEALKRASVSFNDKITDAQKEIFEQLLGAHGSEWIDLFVEGKLRGHHFYQILWELQDGLYLPKAILDYKNLDLRITDRQLVYYNEGKPVQLDDRKFIRSTYRRSKLQAILKYYVFFAHSINNWGQFVETYGKPARIGKYAPTSSAKEVEILRTATKALGTDQAAIISESTNIEFKDFANKAESKDLYKTLCEFVTERVTKRILGQTLTTDQTQYGTQALGAVQNEVRKDIRDGDIRDLKPFLEEILGRVEQINWGTDNLELYPEIHDPVNLVERMNIVNQAVRLGLPVTKKYMYETFNIDEPQKGEEVVEVPILGLGGGVPDAQSKNERRSDPFADAQRKAGQFTETARSSMKELSNPAHRPCMRGSAPHPEGVMSKAVQDKMKPLLDKLQAELRKLGSLEELMAYRPDWFVREFAGVLADAAANRYLQSRKAKQANDITVKIVWDEEAVDTINAFRNQAMVISTVRTIGELNLLKEAALESIKAGGTFRDFMDSAELAGFSPDNPYHFRTEYDTAFASAQMAANWHNLTADRDIFPYLRYVTMGDDLVREEHAMLDGVVAAVDDPFWDTNYPPNGWNCRCDVEQLTADEAEGDDKFGQPAPDAPVDLQFRMNCGKSQSLANHQTAKFDEFTVTGSGELANSNNLSTPGTLFENAQKGSLPVADDYRGYPLRFSAQLPTEAINTAKQTVKSPDEVWQTFPNVRLYLKREGDKVTAVTAIKGQVKAVNEPGSETDVNKLRKGYQEA